MNNRFRHYWQLLLESLWFVPGLMVCTAIALAAGLIELDASSSWNGTKQYPLFFGVGADGSRGMLTAVAGSMLTVAALVFSLTLSTITQVSSQYSPRVLRNFMSDRTNQVVMGYFVGVFTYCLIVLGTIRGSDEQKFVPATAVLIGLVLALGGVVALILFIHHIAESLQTGNILKHIYEETVESIDGLFPKKLGEAIEDVDEAEAARYYVGEQSGWVSIYPEQTGYLQRINTDGLLKWASGNQAVLRIEKKIGAFVGEHNTLFSIRTDMKRPDNESAEWSDDILKYVTIGNSRSIGQDVSYGIQQLVDIALKALSPGINDTTTGIMAVDYLGAVCARLAQRPFPTRLRSDGKNLRILVTSTSFDNYIRLAFDLVRINSKANYALFRRLLRALDLIVDNVISDDRKAIIREQALLIMAHADDTLVTDYEKKSVRTLYDELKEKWT